MQSVILVIHLIVSMAIVAIVLVQPAESGGFMGGGGSGTNMMVPRRKDDALVRATYILTALFFLTSLSLAVIAEHHTPAKSVLEKAVESPAPAATAPIKNVAPTQPAAAPAKPAAAPEAPAKKSAPEKKKKPTAPVSTQ